MITTKVPESWQHLEGAVATLLAKCGLEVERAKTVPLVRGEVVIDVFARDTHGGRDSVLFCECKRWKTAVPKTVVHSFRTVVADGGANTGYIISSRGFQAGAVAAAQGSNIRLRTWPEFQLDFEPLYLENYFRPRLEALINPLYTYVEPISPGTFLASGRLPEANILAFLDLKARYEVFVTLCLMQSPFMVSMGHTLSLPVAKAGQEKIPASVANAEGYEEFLEAAEQTTSHALAEFRSLLVRSR